jgi:hypothetical protein
LPGCTLPTPYLRAAPEAFPETNDLKLSFAACNLHYNSADQNGPLGDPVFIDVPFGFLSCLVSTTALPFNSFKHLDEKNTNDFANIERARSG